VAYAILKHSANIFSLALPGANTLIPYYLLEIKNIIQKLDKHPQKVVERCLMILASLIPFSNHFEGIEIPIDSEVPSFVSHSFFFVIVHLLSDNGVCI
jgi:hypothetical protein